MPSILRITRLAITAGTLALGSTIVSTWACAQQAGSPEALQAATELMAIMSPEMIGQVSQQMTAVIWPQMENSLGSKVDAATMSELREEFERQLVRFTSEATKDAPAIYAKYFTAQELREMTAFYRTPTGAKTLQLVPKVMGEYMTTLLPKMQGFQSDVAAGVQNIMRKHGYGN